MATRRENRIFWLGMHVVLTKTELPRLRSLGYEVFNPPYIAPYYDQSAEMNWDREQPTSLPPEVFQALSTHSFFYNPISPPIAELLNEYFGTIIVTINPDWLGEILKVYHGRIIYRTYGQLTSVSQHLWTAGFGRKIIEREDFTFVPFNEEVIDFEHTWLKERMEIVPYHLPMDVFEHRDTWNIDEPHLPEIMVSCPNIPNAYYGQHYRYLDLVFPFDFLRIYGIQPKPYDDPRVIGTLSRSELMNRYRRSAGYFYTHRLARVCYLPPLEMMTVGGPVIFLTGSLLTRYFPADAPGLAHDPFEAEQKLTRLIKGDRSFIQEVIASQKEVRLRYAPEHVNLIFDRVLPRLIEAHSSGRPMFLEPGKTKSQRKRVYVLFHFPGHIVTYNEGKYTSSEGIPRVMRKLVHSILQHSDYDIVVTCREDQYPETLGFFAVPDAGDRVQCINVHEPVFVATISEWEIKAQAEAKRILPDWSLGAVKRRIRRILGTGIPPKTMAGAALLLLTLPLAMIAFFVIMLFRVGYLAVQAVWNPLVERRSKKYRALVPPPVVPDPFPYVGELNKDPNAACVVIPHYYLFPEAKRIEVPSVLYLPDYMPHFVTESFDGNAPKNVQIGHDLAQLVKCVLTNSEFTRSYLPDCALQVPAEKIAVVPIPLLHPRGKSPDLDRIARMKQQIGNSPFLFYPTQNRPNKQIGFLFRLLGHLIRERPNLKLVLTCGMAPVPETAMPYVDYGIEPNVVFLQALSDEDVTWLYQHAAALCLTSTMEGNFPPQIFEALSLNTPLVATRLPMISDVLKEATESLLLCEPLNQQQFLDKIAFALDHRDEVLQRQRVAYEKLLQHADDSQFSEGVISIIQKIAA